MSEREFAEATELTLRCKCGREHGLARTYCAVCRQPTLYGVTKGSAEKTPKTCGRYLCMLETKEMQPV